MSVPCSFSVHAVWSTPAPVWAVWSASVRGRCPFTPVWGWSVPSGAVFVRSVGGWSSSVIAITWVLSGVFVRCVGGWSSSVVLITWFISGVVSPGSLPLRWLPVFAVFAGVWGGCSSAFATAGCVSLWRFFVLDGDRCLRLWLLSLRPSSFRWCL